MTTRAERDRDVQRAAPSMPTSEPMKVLDGESVNYWIFIMLVFPISFSVLFWIGWKLVEWLVTNVPLF